MQHPLQTPIQLSETITAIKSLNNGRAAGPDGLFAEYFGMEATQLRTI
jgi:hypothetical protein